MNMKDVADVFWEVCREMEVESFMDVDSGESGIVGLHYWEQKSIRRKICLDIYKVKPPPEKWEIIIMDARDMLKRFPPKSIDVVQACDFIEHLPKGDALKWLRDCETIARRAILVFTPLGFVEKPAGEAAYPDNPYQKHLSGWTYEEFEELGFRTAKDDPQNLWRESGIIAWRALK